MCVLKKLKTFEEKCFFLAKWGVLINKAFIALAMVKIRCSGSKINGLPRYTESVKFSSQNLQTAWKQKPHRGLGTR